MPIEIFYLADYFSEYLSACRKEYRKFISIPPKGPGYPKLKISPYLGASEFQVYLANNGIVVNQIGVEPEHKWFVAGGPAIKVYYEPTLTPSQFKSMLLTSGLVGKKIGIYRVVAQERLPNRVWKGRIDGIVSCIERKNIVGDINAQFYKVAISLKELINIITFGAFGTVIPIPLPTAKNDIGFPYRIKNLGFSLQT